MAASKDWGPIVGGVLTRALLFWGGYASLVIFAQEGSPALGGAGSLAAGRPQTEVQHNMI